VKDIKTAILAADLIVNNWGFHDYRLNIYGDMERSPAYSSECQQIIDSKGLRGHVVMKGLGNPLVALEDAVHLSIPCLSFYIMSVLMFFSGYS
jgi:hypothetical protein